MQHQAIQPELLNPRETAELVGISFQQINKVIYGQRKAPQGFPAPVKVGGRIKFRRRDLDEWIDSLPPMGGQQQPAPEPAPEPAPAPAPARPRGRPRKQPRAAGGAA